MGHDRDKNLAKSFSLNKKKPNNGFYGKNGKRCITGHKES